MLAKTSRTSTASSLLWGTAHFVSTKVSLRDSESACRKCPWLPAVLCPSSMTLITEVPRGGMVVRGSDPTRTSPLNNSILRYMW